MSNEQVESQPSDMRWCYDTVQDVSRTFALTIAELKEPMADEICVGYLLCRVADTVEDATHIPPTDQYDLLRSYSRALDPDDDTTIEEFRAAVDPWLPADPSADWTVVAEAPRVVATFQGLPASSREIIRPSVRELTDGMAEFVDRYAEEGGLRIQTIAELEEYCWYVAGTIGSFVTRLLVDDVEPTERDAFEDNATAFARLLQLVNVAKDVDGDYREEDNVYLPAGLLAEEDLAAADIDDPEKTADFVPVVSRIADRAEGYLDDAEAWLEAMPETRGNTLAAWAIPFLLAVGTIRELQARPEDVFEDGVKVSRQEVYALLARFAGDGEPSLGDLRREMRAGSLAE
ncbi:phytoene/squalene synthase family protein [Halorhabdus amylolytica]|uniref:phytoene/squalene synthase family protein n=1 Tax=Halorhabdus amylolytica TaxID=2559573 RepID=UPI0010AA7350|nr:phytoene/squalene synthase family protein [Halorhabdus amylolytica]